MRSRLLMLAVLSIGLLAVPLAHAQLAINVPLPTTEAAQPGSTVLVTPPTADGSSPGQAAGVPNPSTVLVYNNGSRERVKTFADYGAVRSFDAGEGLLTMQDGTEVTFPSNFAFTTTPQPGQPITIYYFMDRDGRAVLSALDPGMQGADSGGGS